jgi:hypothetical protein
MSETSERGLGEPEPGDLLVLGVEQPTGLVGGDGREVGRGWVLFVDRRTAAGARPGAIVVAARPDGRLIVGELAHEADGAGGWAVRTRGGGREAIDRDGVRGTIWEAQPPAAYFGRLVRDEDGAG